MGRRLLLLFVTLGGLLLASLGTPATARQPSSDRVTDDRVTQDNTAGSYSRLDGTSDGTHRFCATSRRQQAEPAVAVNPRNPHVIVAGAVDQCSGEQRYVPIANAQGWLGFYRSTNGGSSWSASLLPGYAEDLTAELPTTNCGQVDATMAFDRDGRLFYGALCPDIKADQAGPVDFHIVVSTFDRDGSRYVRTVGVNADAKGAPDLTTAPDKPNLAVDITNGPHEGNVYVAYSNCPRIVLESVANSIGPCSGLERWIEVARSTDHGATFLPPVAIASYPGGPHDSDVAIGPDGNVYVTATTMGADGLSSDVLLSRSTDGGASFSAFTRVTRVQPFNSAQYAGTNASPKSSDQAQHNSFPCGDGAFACATGFTFSPIRTLSAVAADASGVHLAWSARLPSGQAKVFVQSSPDGVRWSSPPVVVDQTRKGHQWFPDIAAADGVIHVVFYDSRVDRAYAPTLPPGNTAAGLNSGPAVDTYEALSKNGGRTWTGRRLSTVSQQPGLEAQLGARTPWLGDYLYVSAVPGRSYAVWADARDVVLGRDTRGGTEDGFDVAAPCSWFPATEDIPPSSAFVTPPTRDPCLSQGGLDLNIYGATLGDRVSKPTKTRTPSKPVAPDGCGRAVECE